MDNEIFVRSCLVGARRLAVSGLAAPISIRDQMLRSYVLARRVPIEWLTDGPVVVVGAGAAGVTFALAAASRVLEQGGQPDVLLVDTDLMPFTRQAEIRTRWIDPTQYDWPAPRWDLGQLGLPLPLRFPADYSNRIALRWQLQLLLWQAKLANPLRLLMPARAVPLRDPVLIWVGRVVADAVRVFGKDTRMLLSGLFQLPKGAKSNQDEPRPRPHPYDGRRMKIVRADNGQVIHGRFTAGLVVYAWGFGRERTCVEDCSDPPNSPDPPKHFRAEGFWENDDFESLAANAPAGMPAVAPATVRATRTRPLVLISGGGDGALQDFIRIATGRRSVREIFAALPEVVQTMLAERLRFWCDHEARTWAWGDDAGACVAARELEDEMTAVIADGYQKAGSNLTKKLDEMLGDTIGSLDLKIAHPLRHFDNRYPLNRLIALLLIDHLGRQCRLPLVNLKRVSPPKGYVCAHDPVACRSHPHDLLLEQLASEPPNGCPPYSSAARRPFPLTAARVIIRHGPRPVPQLWARLVPIRQLPPFHVGT
jgi:hypothetical protein